MYITITSRKNNLVTELSLLSEKKKERDKSGVFVIEGIKLIEEANYSDLNFASVLFTEKAYEKYKDIIDKICCDQKFFVTDEVYAKVSTEDAPQGIIASVEKPKQKTLDNDSVKSGGFVFLEDIQNPLNIGAVLRCCFSFGFDKVVFSAKCADIYSPKCARAAMGSLFKITPYFTDNMADEIKKLKSVGNRVFCTSLSERSIKLGEIQFEESDSFVIGNEGHGVSEEVLNSCSDSLFIPMNKNAESLNAATAAAVVMWEMKKNNL